MAYQSIWYHTKLPQEIIDIFLSEYEKTIELHEGSIANDILNENVRKNKIGWISDSNWFCGMIYSYVMKSNNKNFLYDISGFENETLQFTNYDKTNFYKWHCDSELAGYEIPTNNNKEDFLTLSNEIVRKLTVSVQLSDEYDYEGGELQLMTEVEKLYTAPKEKGTIIIFDSRTKHRVRKIKSGSRKSLVGWVVGPRWK